MEERNKHFSTTRTFSGNSTIFITAQSWQVVIMASLCPPWTRRARRGFGLLGIPQWLEFRQRTCLFPCPCFEAGRWNSFLKIGGQAGCNFYGLKITAFKLTLRRWKDMTMEHKWILCKKLETEMERYDLTYRISTTGTWFIDYGLSYERASASWKAQSKVVFFSL